MKFSKDPFNGHSLITIQVEFDIISNLWQYGKFPTWTAKSCSSNCFLFIQDCLIIILRLTSSSSSELLSLHDKNILDISRSIKIPKKSYLHLQICPLQGLCPILPCNELSHNYQETKQFLIIQHERWVVNCNIWSCHKRMYFAHGRNIWIAVSQRF